MGTPDPLVRIEAATLAGGDNNQDRYAYGDGWAFVLDGASSFSESPPVHDGAWYAERLKAALAAQLVAYPQSSTKNLVANAIREASADHDSTTQGPCPTSTIALARWNHDQVELYVLGDSCAAILAASGEVPTLLEDSRIEQIGSSFRQSYRQRLAEGHGFDGSHRCLLAELQAVQYAARNRAGGYWIAGDDPRAAAQGQTQSVLRERVCIALFSDGLTSIQPPEQACKALAIAPALPAYLAQLESREDGDLRGSVFPRAKLHDDKTVVLICLS